MPDPLGLTDADYWSNPTGTLDPVFDRISSEELNGVLIGAPGSVALDTRATLPVVAYRGGSYFDVRSLEFTRHAVLVAVDVERNLVRVADAVEIDDPLGSPPFAGPVPKGYTASPYLIDARGRLNLPWEPGTYLFSIIMRERVSNRVRVSLGKSPQGFKDEAVEKFIAARRRQYPPGEVSPPSGDPLPCYQPQPESPPIPLKNGIALKIERVLLLEKDAKWILHGAFRLPALPHEIVPAPEVRNPDLPPVPAAIIRIALLVTGADTGRWSLLQLRVPSYDPGFTGYFSLDLMQQAPHLTSTPQTYFFYALSGQVLEGPVASALVPESWVNAGR
jgi:hypothetical protein